MSTTKQLKAIDRTHLGTWILDFTTSTSDREKASSFLWERLKVKGIRALERYDKQANSPSHVPKTLYQSSDPQASDQGNPPQGWLRGLAHERERIGVLAIYGR
ncbi:hypothetical protein QCA50_006963 [Cerrena zonata]|uniref:Uncharacterized protein n=1 Tax=Cerrena zonata TaxID=2478898 RepID=A0AAW0GAB8_9APHY